MVSDLSNRPRPEPSPSPPLQLQFNHVPFSSQSQKIEAQKYGVGIRVLIVGLVGDGLSVENFLNAFKI